MSDILEVREFDKIIYSDIQKPNFKTITNKKDFDNLLTFIREFKGEEQSADTLEFFNIGYKRDVGEYVTVKNYVGLIEMKDGFQIEILPKISFADGEENKTKEVFLKMLRSLREFKSKAFSSSDMNVDKFNLYEIFISMYLKEVSNLLKKGIKSGYVTLEDNLTKYKGKLIVKEHILNNLAHSEKFYVFYDEFSPNCAENKLIKSTLLKLKNISTQNENRREVTRLLDAFDGVKPSNNYDLDFSKVSRNRNKEYDVLMIWSKVFLCNKSFTTFSGSTVARALLFPMEKVFESYVAQKMKNCLSSKDWSVFIQDRAYHLFDEPKRFSLRPDIVLREKTDGGRTIVLDTKWKRLNDDPSKNYGVSQTDMYQMYAYSKKYKTPMIWVLYPWNEECQKPKNSKMQFIASDNDDVMVNLFFVDVANTENSVKELFGELQNSPANHKSESFGKEIENPY